MQKETVNSLQSQWNAAENQVEKYDQQIQSATVKLNQNKEQAAEVADQIAKAEKNQSKFGNVCRMLCYVGYRGSAIDSTKWDPKRDKILDCYRRRADHVWRFTNPCLISHT